jgi:hypothetical protein
MKGDRGGFAVESEPAPRNYSGRRFVFERGGSRGALLKRLLHNEEKILQKLSKDHGMSQKIDDEQKVSLEQLVVSHSYEMLALITVLEKKGILTRHEVIEVINELKDSE